MLDGSANPVGHRAVICGETVPDLLLPCNVVVRSAGDTRTVVEALDPQIRVRLTDNDGLRPVADDDAAGRLRAALTTLDQA